VSTVDHDPALKAAYRAKACGGARAPFDTADAAYCYCMCWQFMHFESLVQILARGHLDQARFPLGACRA
jgi:hypothetical protein